MARPHGTKYIETPEKMFELFKAYVQQVKSNPRIIKVFGGKDFEERENRVERPLTLEGFQNYCQENICNVDQYFKNSDERYNDYIHICDYIRRLIRQDQIEGGMVGQYNASITQRLNSLKESTESDGKVEHIIKVIHAEKINKYNITDSTPRAIEGIGGGEEV